MKKDTNTKVADALKLLDDAISYEIQEIMNLNHKAQNYQKLADEKFEEMASLFEKLVPCKDRVGKLYNSLDNTNLFNKLENILNLREILKDKENDGK